MTLPHMCKMRAKWRLSRLQALTPKPFLKEAWSRGVADSRRRRLGNDLVDTAEAEWDVFGVEYLILGAVDSKLWVADTAVIHRT